MYSFFHDQIIPELIEQEKRETGNDVTKQAMLKRYGLTTLCLATIYKWMSNFGFKYSLSKKTYYVDGHEAPETVAYRRKYVDQYLKDELRCYRWVQLSDAEIEEVQKENDKFEKERGYKYIDPLSGLTMHEFHVDDLDNSHEKIEDSDFGGFLSVRKRDEDRPIIMIGQDECIFKQYLLVKKQWILPDGQTAANPKEEGMGIMISSFCLRDFGYGFKLNSQQLAIINNYREGKNYIDEEAAMEVLKCKEKQPLTNSPFIRKFIYGVNSEGFWNYHHMVIQLAYMEKVLNSFSFLITALGTTKHVLMAYLNENNLN